MESRYYYYTEFKMKKLHYLFIISLLVISCSDEDVQSKETFLDLPSTSYSYLAGDEIGTLGRVLFYDKSLSVNNAVSCASCHKQSIAFADNTKFSRGFDNRLTVRNSMPIQNLAGSFFGGVIVDDILPTNGFFVGSASGLFWDGRGFDQTRSLLLPVVNHIEMGVSDLNELSEKLSAIDYYPELFAAAFSGDETINPDKIGFALQAFTHSISSTNTKLDRYLMGQAQLSAKEAVGMELFMNKYDCNSCHQVESPQGYIFAGTFANIGLETNYSDPGLELTTDRSFDDGKFKIPSLRNVVLTGPYMHDGRFESLEEVVNHYKTGVTQHPNLDFRLRDENGAPKRPDITDVEMQAIIAFLGTMTDYEMITDERFSNPFKTR